MKRSGLVVLALVPPLLMGVRAVIRYNEEQATVDRVFGTEEEQRAGAARVIASANSDQAAGAAAGAHETEQGCLDKGFEREKSEPDRYAGLMHFLEGCLRAAQSTPGFCDRIPPYRATMSPDEESLSEAYQDGLCRQHGFTDWQCRASVRVVQLHCHPLK